MMEINSLPYDPYNVIITGVGGQGNVMASRVMGQIMSRKGFYVTIGETFGASQRGGSVMSHLRLSSSTWSPQIPKGKAHLVISLEPTETIRVLADYGNPDTQVLCNTRPVHSVTVLSGEQDYPSMAEIKSMVTELSAGARFVDATDVALEMGNPILGNIMMMGAAAGIGVLPLDRDSFGDVITQTFSADQATINLKPYDKGVASVDH